MNNTILFSFELHHFIKHILPPSISITADLDGYSFLLHIVYTDLRPDLVGWDEKQKRAWYVELMKYAFRQQLIGKRRGT